MLMRSKFTPVYRHPSLYHDSQPLQKNDRDLSLKKLLEFDDFLGSPIYQFIFYAYKRNMTYSSVKL